MERVEGANCAACLRWVVFKRNSVEIRSTGRGFRMRLLMTVKTRRRSRQCRARGIKSAVVVKPGDLRRVRAA